MSGEDLTRPLMGAPFTRKSNLFTNWRPTFHRILWYPDIPASVFRTAGNWLVYCQGALVGGDFFCKRNMLGSQGCGNSRFKTWSQIIFTHFCSRFIRHVSGGLFWVKVDAGREMQTNHFLWRWQNPSFCIFRNDLSSNNCQKKIYSVKCAAYLTGTRPLYLEIKDQDGRYVMAITHGKAPQGD